MNEMNDIVKLAIDAYHGNVEKYSVAQSMETLQKALVEANGGSTKLNYKNIRDGKCNGLFALIEEILSRTVVEGLQGQMIDSHQSLQLTFTVMCSQRNSFNCWKPLKLYTLQHNIEIHISANVMKIEKSYIDGAWLNPKRHFLMGNQQRSSEQENV